MRNVDPVLLSKLNNQHQTKANDAQPKMSVAVARARSTVMDNSYWVVETIRTGTGLGDVSLTPRRQRPNGVPDRIFEIHVQNGVVGTATKAYPDKLKQGWQNQFSLGAGSKVGIAFDGEWVRYRDIWRLVTHEEPWIFWVDGDGNLQTQHWDDATTKVQLATGVTYCKAIRGWKNLNIADKDQGIVIGYIKSDGLVYYRNYCQALDLTYSWEVERELTEFTGTASSLNLFITNDYRMGFTVADNLDDIYWYITDRDWAGMAIAADTISVAPAELTVDLIPIEYIIPHIEDEYLTVAPAELVTTLLYADTDNAFAAINAPNIDDDWGWIINLTFDHPIPTLSLVEVVVTNVDNSTTITMASIEKVSDEIYRLHVSDIVESGINNVSGDIKVTVTGAINPAGYTYITMEHTFTPINLVPTFIPLPEVEVIFNE